MPVKKDESGRRSVQAEVEVPGTPEEVWEAIATGPGITSWFVPRCTPYPFRRSVRTRSSDSSISTMFFHTASYTSATGVATPYFRSVVASTGR